METYEGGIGGRRASREIEGWYSVHFVSGAQGMEDE